MRRYKIDWLDDQDQSFIQQLNNHIERTNWLSTFTLSLHYHFNVNIDVEMSIKQYLLDGIHDKNISDYKTEIYWRLLNATTQNKFYTRSSIRDDDLQFITAGYLNILTDAIFNLFNLTKDEFYMTYSITKLIYYDVDLNENESISITKSIIL